MVGEHESLLHSSSTIMVAINGTKGSIFALKWALNTLSSEGKVNLRLFHVRPPITMIPTPMGNRIPISQVREDVVSAYKKDIELQTHTMILPYKLICMHRKVDAEIVIKEDDDIAEGIAEEVGKFNISRLIIGASSRNMITRKLKGIKMSTKIAENTPSFCTVFVIRNGKLSAVRSGTDISSKNGTDRSSKNERISDNSSCHSSISCSESTDADTLEKSLLPQNFSFQILCDDTTTDLKSVDLGSPCSILHRSSTSSKSLDDASFLCFPTSEVQSSTSKMSSYRNYRGKVKSWSSGLSSLSDDSSGSSFLGNEIDFELEKLRIELSDAHGTFEILQKESEVISQQFNELSSHQKERFQLKDISIREQEAKAAIGMVRKRQAASEIGLAFEKEFIEEASVSEEADYDANLKCKEQIRLERTLSSDDKRYNNHTWEEIKSATSSFSDALKLGAGANGTVYMGTFHHTTAAVKIINSNEECETKQFKQELEIMSRIHHPHILMLLGACPERGCLVYEYMENGSLDDRLKCKNNTPPLPWYYRLRIAWEVASALVFLHHSKPVPIVHRDLKPANILLNEKYVSKIGDVGLSTLLPSMNFSMDTLCKDTAPVGTFFYIDPEYQRTGLLSPKSDTYALGMVILELLTAKQPMGLAHTVEMALEDGNLMEVLDHKAGQWPRGPAQELAFLGVSCLELRRRDRPDLKDHALPVLERLKEIADKAGVKPYFTTKAYHISNC